MTIEERLKMVIGDLVVQNQMLLLQLEKSKGQTNDAAPNADQPKPSKSSKDG